MAEMLDSTRSRSHEHRWLQSMIDMVTSEGCFFEGVQVGLLGAPAELWFTNPETEHKLKIEFNQNGFYFDDLRAQVKAVITKDDEIGQKENIPVKISRLQKISRNLEELKVEVDAILERKKS